MSTSVPPTAPSGDDAPGTGWHSGVGATDVDTECRTGMAASTFAEGAAEVVCCSEGASRDDAVVTVTVSILFMGGTLAGAVVGGALQKAETAGLPVTETVFTGVSAAGEASIGAGGVGTMAAELVDAAEETDIVGHDGEGGCDALAAALVACVEAVERLEAGAIWATFGAQVTVAGAEMDACSNGGDPGLVAVPQDICVSAEGQNKVAEAAEGWRFAVDGALSLPSPGVEVIADGCSTDASVVVAGDGMFVLDGKMSGTVVNDVCVPREDAGDVVGGAGVASVTVWVDSGRVFAVWDTTGACSTGGEEGLEAPVVGETGGSAGTLLGLTDVEEWL